MKPRYKIDIVRGVGKFIGIYYIELMNNTPTGQYFFRNYYES